MVTVVTVHMAITLTETDKRLLALNLIPSDPWRTDEIAHSHRQNDGDVGTMAQRRQSITSEPALTQRDRNSTCERKKSYMVNHPDKDIPTRLTQLNREIGKDLFSYNHLQNMRKHVLTISFISVSNVCMYT